MRAGRDPIGKAFKVSCGQYNDDRLSLSVVTRNATQTMFQPPHDLDLIHHATSKHDSVPLIQLH